MLSKPNHRIPRSTTSTKLSIQPRFAGPTLQQLEPTYVDHQAKRASRRAGLATSHFLLFLITSAARDDVEEMDDLFFGVGSISSHGSRSTLSTAFGVAERGQFSFSSLSMAGTTASGRTAPRWLVRRTGSLPEGVSPARVFLPSNCQGRSTEFRPPLSAFARYST